MMNSGYDPVKDNNYAPGQPTQPMNQGYDPNYNNNNYNNQNYNPGPNYNNNQGYNPGPNYNNNQGYNPPNYSSNVVSTTPIIVNNQTSPRDNTTVVVNNAGKYKTSSIVATCPTCRTTGPTSVTTSFSCSNYCCYLCFDPIIYVIYQLVRGKDIICCDATHNCPNCGAYIASYSAC